MQMRFACALQNMLACGTLRNLWWEPDVQAASLAGQGMTHAELTRASSAHAPTFCSRRTRLCYEDSPGFIYG